MLECALSIEMQLDVVCAWDELSLFHGQVLRHSLELFLSNKNKTMLNAKFAV